MPLKNYLPTTWYAPRVQIYPSAVDGNGMFATSPIHKGETVVILGGMVRSDAEFRNHALTFTQNSSFNSTLWKIVRRYRNGNSSRV